MRMKNLRNLPIFACLFLIVFMPMRAEALPPPSPAGGNYLVLDGVDDHAILDFETFGLLIPKDTDAFTFEAWIYLTTPSNADTHALVLSQQVRMYVWNHGPNVGLRLMSAVHLHPFRLSSRRRYPQLTERSVEKLVSRVVHTYEAGGSSPPTAIAT